MSLQIVPLEFTSLAEIDDGRIQKLLRMHLQRIAQDCMDRPGDKTKRKVTIEFIIDPIVSPEGHCDDARVTIECKSKVPTYRTKPYEMRVNTRGFAFNEDFPDQVDQSSIFPKE
jgi:hypothetical protein